MKTKRLARFLIILVMVVALSILVVSTALANSKSYYGIAIIYYTNYIDDNYGSWTARYYDQSSTSMDQFGVSFWSVKVSCGGDTISETYSSRTNRISQNRTSIGESWPRANYLCPYGTYKGHNYIQHWWQDSGYPGDGGTINQSRVLSYP